MRQLPKARALAVALAALVLQASCATAPTPSRPPPAAFVIPSSLPNGRAELTIAPSYRLGAVLTVPIAVIATRGSITGPVTARVMASGINEGGLPAEVLVRELATAPITVPTGRGSTAVTWDTKDGRGVVVPADAYSLVLEFRSVDGGSTVTTKAAVALELR